MGRKTATAGALSSVGSKQAKMTTSSTIATNAPPNRAQTAMDNHPFPLYVINKYELRLSNSEHIVRFNSVTIKRIIKPKYMDVNFLINRWALG